MKNTVMFLYALIVSLCLIGCMNGDNTRGEPAGIVTGTVDDGTRVPVADAEVSIGNISDTTNAQGSFRLEGVPRGKQTIKVEKEGYPTYTKEIDVQPGESEANDVKIVLGGDEPDCTLYWVNDDIDQRGENRIMNRIEGIIRNIQRSEDEEYEQFFALNLTTSTITEVTPNANRMYIQSLKLDAPKNTMYWVNNTDKSALWKADLDGSNPEEIIMVEPKKTTTPPPLVYYPSDMVLITETLFTDHEDWIIWNSSKHNKVQLGSVTGEYFGDTSISDVGTNYTIALGVSRNLILSFATTNNQKIYAIPLGKFFDQSTTNERPLSEINVTPVVAGDPLFTNLQANDGNGRLYWIAYSKSLSRSYVGYSNMENGTGVKAVYGADIVTPFGICVDHENNRVYWGNSDHRIVYADLDLNVLGEYTAIQMNFPKLPNIIPNRSR